MYVHIQLIADPKATQLITYLSLIPSNQVNSKPYKPFSILFSRKAQLSPTPQLLGLLAKILHPKTVLSSSAAQMILFQQTSNLFHTISTTPKVILTNPIQAGFDALMHLSMSCPRGRASGNPGAIDTNVGPQGGAIDSQDVPQGGVVLTRTTPHPGPYPSGQSRRRRPHILFL